MDDTGRKLQAQVQILREILKNLSQEKIAIADKDREGLKRLLEQRQSLQALLDVFNSR